MSEQVKRWPMWRAIEELGPDDWVVRDTCYDTLAQRCRGLERVNDDAIGRNTFLETENDTLRAENVRLAEWYSEAGVREDTLRADVEEARRTAGFWKDEHLTGNRVIDQLHAEVADLKARLLEAERGAEALVRLRAEKRELESKAWRYDYISSMWPPQFTDLFERSVETGESFDILVDAAMEAAACANTDGATATP